MTLNKKVSNQGFTLIEILVVIGIIAVLAAVVLIAINPARQFAQARDSQRTANANAILNAIGQNFADNAGIFNLDFDDDGTDDCDALPDPGDPAAEIGDGELDIRDCLVPDYIPELPVDPAIGEPFDAGAYYTGYTIEVTDGSRIQICTFDDVSTEEPALDRDEPICVTR